MRAGSLLFAFKDETNYVFKDDHYHETNYFMELVSLLEMKKSKMFFLHYHWSFK